EVRAYVLSNKASLGAASHVRRIAEKEAWARAAIDAGAQDRAVSQLALYSLGWARAMGGHSIDDVVEQAGGTTDASRYIAPSPQPIAGQRHVWRGELPQARAILERLLALADERGEPPSYALQRLHVCELELRAGNWRAAERWLDEWVHSVEGQMMMRPMYHRCRALLYAGVGPAEEAERWAADAIARGEASGSRWDWLEAMRARGIGALLARDPARAAESLGEVWRHTRREGVGEPGVFPAAPELV